MNSPQSLLMGYSWKLPRVSIIENVRINFDKRI